MKQRFRKWGIRSILLLAALLLLGALLMGYGTSTADAARLDAFAQAVSHWQHDPEFRAVHREYVDLGSGAMRTRVAGVNAGSAIIFLRSLPGLPEHLRVNPSSYEHYKRFTQGPMSAYLHLSAEQGLTTAFDLLQKLCREGTRSDAEIVYFLSSFKVHDDTIADAGAVQSVRNLINDIEPSRGFVVRDGVVEKMREQVTKLATKLGYSTDLDKLSPEQQLDLWQHLDAEIKQNDYELWRSKQVSDFLSGVWAQGYGPMYSGVIEPTLQIRNICRIAAPIILLLWIGLGSWIVWRRRRPPVSLADATDSEIKEVAETL